MPWWVAASSTAISPTSWARTMTTLTGATPSSRISRVSASRSAVSAAFTCSAIRSSVIGRSSPRPWAVISLEWLIPLAPADQHLVGGGLEGEAEPEKPVEGGVRGAPAVEPEDELVQVGLEVLLAQPVVDAQRPPLRVRGHPMDPGQDQVGQRVADHPRVVLHLLEPGVARPAVAHHGAADGDHGGDEGAERDRRGVADRREPDPPRPLAFDLDRAGEEELAVVRPPGADRLPLGAKGDRGLVHLH